jgi:alpha-1,3-glucan synthase
MHISSSKTPCSWGSAKTSTNGCVTGHLLCSSRADEYENIPRKGLDHSAGNVLGSVNVSIPSDGCRASDFDQCGDLEAFGVHPDWMRQLTKFASVQDRLREWQPAVLERLIKFSCLAIKASDFDAIRIDKSTQVTVDPMAAWATGVRQCAAQLGMNNFLISGEVTGGNSFGALYL